MTFFPSLGVESVFQRKYNDEVSGGFWDFGEWYFQYFGLEIWRAAQTWAPPNLPRRVARKNVFFVFLKNRNAAKMGIRLETGVPRIRTYEGIFELNSMFHNPAPKNI